MKSQSDLQYVQIQPSQDLLDVRFQTMSPVERGVYWTIKLYLYANGGKFRLDEAMLAKVTGCENFCEVWEKIKPAFVIKADTIKHKVVTKDLRKAKKFSQDKRRAGLASAKARRTVLKQRFSGDATKLSKVKLSKVKLSKEKEGALSKFQRPAAGEVSEYAESIGFHQLNSQQFVDFYEAKGWMVGKNKMRDWRAAVRTWKARSRKEGQHDNFQRPTGRPTATRRGGKLSRRRDYTHEPAPDVTVLKV